MGEQAPPPPKPKQGELVIGAWNAEEEMAKDNMHQVNILIFASFNINYCVMKTTNAREIL